MKGSFEEIQADSRYWWLNKAIIVGRAVRSSNGIVYDAYELVTTQK